MAQSALKQYVKNALTRGFYRESFHAEKGHPERELSIDDVLYGLDRKDWILARPPNYDDKHQTWEYLIRTVDIEGRELHIKIAVIPTHKRIEIITRW